MVISLLTRLNEPDQRARLSRNRATSTKRWAMAVLMMWGLMISGCEINIRAGQPPDIAALENGLQIGKSTFNDVQETMGEPYGQGRSMFPFHDAPRDVWTYYYEEGDLEDDRRTFLYVFFDEDIYDGYIWFSSLPQ